VIGQQHAVAHHTQAAGPLGDQHVTVREPCHRPGDFQPVDDGDDAEMMPGGAVYLRLAEAG